MNAIKDILKTYWGYDSFRPLQREAMEAIVSGRDSLVVLPTGGGKSLCYQAPALASDGLVVVICPLIALMQDQVSGLRENGVHAASLNSTQAPEQQERILGDVRDGTVRLLYVAPERLVTARFMALLDSVSVNYFVIDEAHCISAWGHDFRPEYRKLDMLKQRYPSVPIHAYTATATPQVQRDIVTLLGLQDAEVHVGSFDRPNLTYRFTPRTDLAAQVVSIVRDHPGDAGVVYCIRRKDVDHMAARLAAQGFRAVPYHAGLGDYERQRNQERFMNEDADIVVATIAFGMGVDKPDVRYVVHAGMPKSLEGYQQESGRAGRDGLPAECHLLYHRADLHTWRAILEASHDDAARIGLDKVNEMYRICEGDTCRHRAILDYFGQRFRADSCGACDVCLGERVTARPEKSTRLQPPKVWDEVEKGLFDHLRKARRDEAHERGLKPYMVFGDAALSELARLRPTDTEAMGQISGIGRTKLKTYGRVFCTAIREYCDERGMATDLAEDAGPETPQEVRDDSPESRAEALFDEWADLDTVQAQLKRSRKWVVKQLAQYLVERALVSPEPWVSESDFERIREVAEQFGTGRIRTLIQALDGEVDEETVRICLACLQNG